MKSIVGKILYDRYRIVQQLSHNDWSAVYLAEDLAPDSPVPCKIERLQPWHNREILSGQSWQKVQQIFETQANILKTVSQHPQIPQLLAFFECDRDFYLVREYIDGISLKQKLGSGLISEEEAIAWLCETLRVLEFVHQQGIAHLNIQPTSLIQDADKRKLLTNFAALENAILFDRQELNAMLNPDFSPEDRLKSDFNSDIYSLGKTIIYALTGKLANSIGTRSTDRRSQAPSFFPHSRTSSEVISDSSHKPTSSIDAHPQAPSFDGSIRMTGTPKAEISPELAKVLNKMLVSHPLQCYQSASEVLRDLDFDRKMVTFPPPFTDNHFASNSASTRNIKGGSAIGSSKISKIIWFLLSLPFIIASIIIFVGLNKNSDRAPNVYSTGDSNALSNNFVEYSNSEYQFALKYPDIWSWQQIDDPITGEIVVFASPKETDADLFAEKVHIAVEYLSSEPTTLEDYSQSVLSRIKDTSDSNIEQYEDFETKIDNSPARMVIYSRTEGSLQLRQLEAFTIKDDRVYIAIYTAERAKFSKFYPTVEKIIDSWEIE